MPRTPVLILFAHPSFEHSRVNRAMVDAVSDLEGITLHDLYEAYPDFHIDVVAEQKIVEKHDVIVFHHPFYWYSSPALLKEWQDQVLLWGWAFGKRGKALKGKKLLSAISTGSPARAYQKGGQNHYPMDVLLAPFDQTARLCGMSYLEPLIFHNANRTDLAAIDKHAQVYRARLKALRDGKN